jgi:hypothetical protein
MADRRARVARIPLDKAQRELTGAPILIWQSSHLYEPVGYKSALCISSGSFKKLHSEGLRIEIRAGNPALLQMQQCVGEMAGGGQDLGLFQTIHVQSSREQILPDS